MDILSDVLRDLKLESAVFSLVDFRAPWGFEKSSVGGAPFYVVVEGRCLFQIEDGDAIEVGTGDLVIVPQGTPYALMSDTDVRRVPFTQILEANGIGPAWSPAMRIDGLNQFSFGGNGPLTRIITGIFAFRDQGRNPLLAALPNVMHVRRRLGNGANWLTGPLFALIDEAMSAEPGFQTITERLAEVMFIQAVRDHIAGTPAVEASWLRGLTDPHVGRALALVHSRPGDPWTVASLAAAVGMSRTVFAARFRSLVGSAVMEYITARRMHVAAGMLSNTAEALSRIARRVGYDSDISFSRAFRRWAGSPPGRYRREGATLAGVAR